MQYDDEAINEYVRLSNAGDEQARRELFELAYERFQYLAHRMLQGFPGLRRWEQTDDIWQNAGLKLWKSMARVQIENARHFHGLAALHIRRELLDLMRQHFGATGMGACQQSWAAPPDDEALRPAQPDRQDDTYEGGKLAQWTEFHQQVDLLSEEEREVVDLLWYQGLSQPDAARMLGLSTRTVKRRWQAARLTLARALHFRLPESIE